MLSYSWVMSTSSLFYRHKASACTALEAHCSSPLSSSSYLFHFYSGVLPEQAMFGLKLQRVESRHSAHSTSETRRTFQNGLLINVSMVLRLEDKIGFSSHWCLTDWATSVLVKSVEHLTSASPSVVGWFP